MRSAPRSLLALLLLALPVHAGESLPPGGTFTVYAGGRVAGSEEWRLRRTNGPLTLTSRARLQRADREQDLSLRVERDPKTGTLLVNTGWALTRVGRAVLEIEAERKREDAEDRLANKHPDGSAEFLAEAPGTGLGV